MVYLKSVEWPEEQTPEVPLTIQYIWTIFIRRSGINLPDYHVLRWLTSTLNNCFVLQAKGALPNHCARGVHISATRLLLGCPDFMGLSRPLCNMPLWCSHHMQLTQQNTQPWDNAWSLANNIFIIVHSPIFIKLTSSKAYDRLNQVT